MNDFTLNIEDRGLQYCGAARIEGPLVVVERVRDVGYDEMVEILDPKDNRASGACSTFRKRRLWCKFWKGPPGFRIKLCAHGFSEKIFGCRFRARCWAAYLMAWADPPMVARPRCPPTAAT